MEAHANSAPSLTDASKRLAHQALVIAENRFELLLLEVQEEREQLMRALRLSMVVAIFGLLAGVAFTATIVVLCWQWSPITVLVILTVFYAGVAALAGWYVEKLHREWHILPATFDELRKDRQCLERKLK